MIHVAIPLVFPNLIKISFDALAAALGIGGLKAVKPKEESDKAEEASTENGTDKTTTSASNDDEKPKSLDHVETPHAHVIVSHPNQSTTSTVTAASASSDAPNASLADLLSKLLDNASPRQSSTSVKDSGQKMEIAALSPTNRPIDVGTTSKPPSHDKLGKLLL